jgi:uncharacterized phage-associated protein
MPGWSTEIANEFIRLGMERAWAFDQMQLQKLVYIAHGWCLAITGEPLTGDRPEAWDFGPMYRRLADALGDCGQRPVTETLTAEWSIEAIGSETIWSELNTIERNVLTSVLLNYGAYSSSQLSTITRGEGAPWTSVYRRGEGRFRDIPHSMIRDQFVRFAQRVSDDPNHD